MFCHRALAQISKTLVSRPGGCSLQNVMRSLLKVHVSRSCSSGVTVHELKSRGLVELRGKDTLEFLQGLVTSDVTLLGGDMNVQYSMMLNVQGRVLYDLLLYHNPRQGIDGVLVECDRSVQEEMVKAVRRYKIRKKVEIRDVTDEWKLYAAVRRTKEAELITSGCVPDPRVPSFGWRILNPRDKPEVELSKVKLEDESEYHKIRYEWGIPEGTLDLPPGNCFPLESNLIFHNGVSFSKGCYVGQELTARTHHTGVTRKRLMPLLFENDVDGSVEPGTNITREDGKNVGKFRNCVDRNGLGLMRTGDLKGQLSIVSRSGDVMPVSAHVPAWWPQD